MKQSFEIYPALFAITQRANNKISWINHNDACKENNLYDELIDACELSHSHLHYGNCIVNTAHTLITLIIGNTIATDSEFEIPDSLFRGLETKNFHGKQFIISYVPVLN